MAASRAAASSTSGPISAPAYERRVGTDLRRHRPREQLAREPRGRQYGRRVVVEVAEQAPHAGGDLDGGREREKIGVVLAQPEPQTQHREPWIDRERVVGGL